MSNAADRITALVLEAAAEKPLADRKQIYLDLAETVAGEACAKTLRALAIEIRNIEDRHKQLVLDLRPGGAS